MRIDNNIIQAEEGKLLRRISDGLLVGNRLSLGYTYYINNELLDEPLLELPEHYEEIDEVIEEIEENDITDVDFEEIILDEDTNEIVEAPETPRTLSALDKLNNALEEVEALKARLYADIYNKESSSSEDIIIE